MVGGRLRVSSALRFLLFAVLGLGAALLLGGCDITVQPITVNTTADGNDANPGDGVCEMTAGIGNCSLRAAVDEANVGGELASITLPAGTYNLTGAAGDDANDTGDLDVSGPAVIAGGGSGAAINAGDLDRAIDVTGIAVLSNIRVTNATVTGDGGGVRVRSGSLVLLNSALENNVATGSGGGVAVLGGSTLMRNSTVSNNTAGSAGGGIYLAPATTGELTNSTVSTNTVDTTVALAGEAENNAPVPVSGPQLAGPTAVASPLPSGAVQPSDGPMPLIIELDVTTRPEPSLSPSEAIEQRRDIADAADDVVETLGSVPGSTVQRTYATLPYVAVQVDAEGLALLESSEVVRAIHPDTLSSPTLAQSIPRINADDAHAAGDTGAGTTIAIVDSGVDAAHPMLAGKVVAQACFAQGSTLGDGTGDCPNGTPSQSGGDAGTYCPRLDLGCWHGTHVASTAAGELVFAGADPLVGVAPDATVIAVNVFSKFTGSSNCGPGVAECILSWTSDQMAALDHIYSLRTTFDIAAVNMSLGGGVPTHACTDHPLRPAIENLLEAGTATVISSGNDGIKTGLSAPACIPTSVSVGATWDNSDTVYTLSNSHANLDLLAPGVNIIAAYPGGASATASGTSMAAPHVAGAFALLRAEDPTASVDKILAALKSTGQNVTDPGNGIAKRRINVLPALAAMATDGGGGGIANRGTLKLTLTTITRNSAPWGGGVATFGTSTAHGTVIANQMVGGNCSTAVGGSMSSLGYSASSDGTCHFEGAGHIYNGFTLLGNLAFNGGPTKTHLPAVDSELLEAVPVGTPTLCDGTFAIDQRNTARPKGTNCDMGSVER